MNDVFNVSEGLIVEVLVATPLGVTHGKFEGETDAFDECDIEQVTLSDLEIDIDGEAPVTESWSDKYVAEVSLLALAVPTVVRVEEA